MIYFKACPRCHGDVQFIQDIYGDYKGCLQCGYLADIEDTRRIEWAYILAAEKSKPKRGRRRKVA